MERWDIAEAAKDSAAVDALRSDRVHSQGQDAHVPYIGAVGFDHIRTAGATRLAAVEQKAVGAGVVIHTGIGRHIGSKLGQRCTWLECNRHLRSPAKLNAGGKHSGRAKAFAIGPITC